MGFPRNLATALIAALLVGAATPGPGSAAGRSPTQQVVPSEQEAPSEPQASPTPEAAPAARRPLRERRRRLRRLARRLQTAGGEPGVSPSAIDAALADVAYDEVRSPRDRGQGSSARVSPISPAAHDHRLPSQEGAGPADTLRRDVRALEQRYGVPGPVLVAIWGLETDFGAGQRPFPDLERAGDARLRLSPRGALPRELWTR